MAKRLTFSLYGPFCVYRKLLSKVLTANGLTLEFIHNIYVMFIEIMNSTSMTEMLVSRNV